MSPARPAAASVFGRSRIDTMAVTAQTKTASDGFTQFSDDEITLALIASGVIEISQQVTEGRPLTLPYPAPLQRGLDRLVVTCLRKGLPPPEGVPELLRRCRKPLAEWPLEWPRDHHLPTPEDRLLDGQIPTALCEAWAYSNRDVEAEMREQRFFLDVLGTCRAADRPDMYVALRELLISKPVLTAFELRRACVEPNLSPLAQHIQNAYKPAPLACVVKGELHCCPTCGNLLLRTENDKLECEDERCRASRQRGGGRRIAASEEVLWLSRELRRFITAPGRAELRLAGQLRELGTAVELWPDFDAYDLRITFPDGDVWAVDVKDWADPFLLARSVKPIPTEPPWNLAFFVFPDDRCQRQRDYERAFINHCRILTPYVRSRSERKLLAAARRKVRGAH